MKINTLMRLKPPSKSYHLTLSKAALILVLSYWFTSVNNLVYWVY